MCSMQSCIWTKLLRIFILITFPSDIMTEVFPFRTALPRLCLKWASEKAKIPLIGGASRSVRSFARYVKFTRYTLPMKIRDGVSATAVKNTENTRKQ